MNKSEATKGLGVKKLICGLISWALNVVPMLTFIIIGFMGSTVVQKVALSVSCVVAVVLLVINILSKLHLRSVFWVLLVGIGMCVDNLAPLFITMAITIMADEFIFEPLYRKYKNEYTINYQIDKRQ